MREMYVYIYECIYMYVAGRGMSVYIEFTERGKNGSAFGNMKLVHVVLHSR